MEAVLQFVKKNRTILLAIVVIVVLLFVLDRFGYITIMREGFASAKKKEGFEANDPATADEAGAPVDADENKKEKKEETEGFEGGQPVPPEPKGCAPRDAISPAELLPKTDGSLWAQMNPMGQGSLQERNFLTAGHHMGITTVGSVMRNANLQLRSEPPNPQVKVSPWLQSTIEPDISRRPLEIGGCA